MTSSIFHQIQQLNTVLDLIDRLQTNLIIPCEISDGDLLALSAIAISVGDYKEQVEERLFVLNKDLNKALEAQLRGTN